MTAALGSAVLLGALALAALAILAIVGAMRASRDRDWQFEMSRVIANSFVPLRRRPFVILGLTLGIWVAAFVPLALGASLALGTGSGGPWAVGLAALAGVFVAGTFNHVLLVRLSLDLLQREETSLGTALSESIGLMGRAVPLVLLQWIGIAFGWALLFAPAFILMGLWIAAVPALVRESPAILGSLGRSAELTRGARWQILLLLMIFFVASLMLTSAATTLGELFGDAGMVVTLAAYVLQIAVGSAGTAAVYHELRSEKEGLVSDDLVTVFA